jgi:hypothetical protein
MQESDSKARGVSQCVSSMFWTHAVAHLVIVMLRVCVCVCACACACVYVRMNSG